MPKPTILPELANANVFINIMTKELAEMFGIRGSNSNNIPHSFKDSGWEVGKYIYSLSNELARRIGEKTKNLAAEKFKKFNAQSTKLPQEIVDEIWVEISNFISEKMNEIIGKEGENEFSGMEHNIKNGLFLPQWKKSYQGVTAEDYQEARKMLLERMPNANDKTEFLRRFKNSLFEYYTENFGLYKEQNQEISGEHKLGRK